METELR